MASKLSPRDKRLLDAGMSKRVGQKPYEAGLWGDQGNKDFVLLEIFDTQNNLIQYENLPFSSVTINETSNNIEIYPGTHIRDLGFESGTFKLRYSFLRKLAGDESTVLLRTKDNQKGEIHTDTSNIYITDDGKVYIGTEEQFRDNSQYNEQLILEDLKYQIHKISPSRKEVRLKAKNIKGSYQEDFAKLQESIRLRNVDLGIEFFGGDLNTTNQLRIQPTQDGFIFTQKMVNSTITIPDVYKVDEIVSEVITQTNILTNGGGELLETNDLGEVITLGDAHQWDSSLHSNAVKPVGWYSGFRDFSSGAFSGTTSTGYHAHWVRNEGKLGGVCMKFPDQNQLFYESSEQWENAPHHYRYLMITTEQLPNLQGQGIQHGDLINVEFDMKVSTPNRGVSIMPYYPGDMITEDIPTSPPNGYFDPTTDPHTETQPTSPPPGSVANTDANAGIIEDKPPTSHAELVTHFGVTSFDGVVGDSSADWGGAGAWRIINYIPGQSDDEWKSPPKWFWASNLTDPMEGTVSDGGEWMWDGTAWITNPSFVSNVPTPPAGTVNPLDFPTAINSHPYQLDGQGTPLFKRLKKRGENDGWQAGTIWGNKGILLFKDDLIWETEFEYTTDFNKLSLSTFDEWFPDTRNVNLDNGKTLYEDIFSNGFIQSVTGVPGGGNSGMAIPWILIFYNNGDIDSTDNPDLESNRYFYYKKGSGVQIRQSKKLHFLKDVDSNLNNKVIDNNLRMSWAFKKANSPNAGTFYYYVIVDDKYFRITDNTSFGELENRGADSGYPMNVNSGFGSITTDPDVFFPHSSYTHYNTIKGKNVTQNKSNTPEGVKWRKSTEDIFYGAGMFGTNGNDLIYGSRNPGATNYNPVAIYDDGSSIFDFDDNPLKIGVRSAKGIWEWNGSEWVSVAVVPPRYSYKHLSTANSKQLNTTVGEWVKKIVKLEIPEDWSLDQKWFLQIIASGGRGGEVGTQGVAWVDNVDVRFTLTQQAETRDVFVPYTAQILSVNEGGNIITVDKSFQDVAINLDSSGFDVNEDYHDGNNPGSFPARNTNNDTGGFDVSYTVYNPFDLRTYLKFENELFLTTNFKPDKLNVSDYPNGLVYKLYKPLPDSYQKFDECIVVKEMAAPAEETVKIVDFIDKDVGDVVLKSPDLNNVESPVQRRSTLFKNETDILTSDDIVSNELKNEFVSQSLDSVTVNTDFRNYENFVNFSSIEKRVRNFKYKLELIETYTAESASFNGISGSSSDTNVWTNKITDVKNNFDPFETYMYYESSSYISSSLGIFYDNAWPKSGGSGTLASPYILAHTTSSQSDTWFSNAITSASLYDEENLSKLSSLLPEYLKEDSENDVYLKFTDMIAQHFDSIWVYINAITDTFDRREKLTEGVSRDLLWNVAKSLGWNLNDGKDLVPLSKFALGKEVTGSAYSDYSTVSERDMSREIWSRIVNNMPFFLKNKGTVRALKGLINIYGIPSTILRVKEYGGPDVPDNETPQFEITRKFTKALDFRGSQYVKTAWSDDSLSSRKPDTIEFRFRAATGSNQILIEKQGTDASSSFWIRLKDNNSIDDYGYVAFQLSGSDGVKEISSSNFPVYDGDFYSVMLRRTSGSDAANVSQSFQLAVGKYDSSRSKINLFSAVTMSTDIAASSSYNLAYSNDGEIYIGGSGDVSGIGTQLSGSVMEYRHWTETLNVDSFRNHIGNPKAYDGNTVSSSYNNCVLRYSFDDNKDLSSDTEGIRDVSSNQTYTASGSHSGFTGNFFSSVVDELKTNIPSIGALRRSTNKIRIEDNPIKPGFILNRDHRATNSAYDSAPNDSNKVGIFFAPTDVINNDIINSVANLNFDNYLGDPRDKLELTYRGLEDISDNYWKKYTSPNNFWDYIRLLKYYDQSLYPQLRKMVPARAKPDIGLLVEPNIFERPKVVTGKTPTMENVYYTSSVDLTYDVITVTGSYNNDNFSVSSYEAYDGNIKMYSYETGSYISSSAENVTKEASGSEFRTEKLGLSLWQRLNTKDKFYATSSITFGDSKYNEVHQPVVSGSRIYGRNQKMLSFYSSSASASLRLAYSSSYYDVDLDNLVDHNLSTYNLYYAGCKNTPNTTTDGNPPVEIIVTSPTKLVTTDSGDSTLKTDEGNVSKFKELDRDSEKSPIKTKPVKIRGLKGLSKHMRGEIETESDRKDKRRKEKSKDSEKEKRVRK